MGAAIVLIVAACGDSGGVPTTPPESTTITTTSLPPAPTTVVPATTTEAVTTTEGTRLPSYSDVIATYPPGTDLCNTAAGIEETADGGSVTFGSFLGESATISIRNGETQFWCLGGKYVVTGTFSELDADGEPIPEGAYLTFNADMEFVQISGFD
jgi:hypothetical protein